MATRTYKPRKQQARRPALAARLEAAERRSQLASLAELARRLNAAGKGEIGDPGEAEALRIVESIVALPVTEPADPARDPLDPSPAVARFNDVAARAPVALWIEQSAGLPHVIGRGVHLLAEPRADEAPFATEVYQHVALALFGLWSVFFWSGGWRRLKRCAWCRQWFVDRTKNTRQQRCSRTCTWAWWNRARRREGAHAQYRNRRRRAPARGK